MTNISLNVNRKIVKMSVKCALHKSPSRLQPFKGICSKIKIEVLQVTFDMLLLTQVNILLR